MSKQQTAILFGVIWSQIAFAQTLTKTFTPAAVGLNGITTVTLTLANPTAAAVNSIEFTDTLPLATFAFQSFVAGATCDIASFVYATGVLTVDQATLAPGASCIVAFTVKAKVTGNITNTTSNLTANLGQGAVSLPGTAATAVLKVVNQPTIAKAFGTPTILLGETTSLTVTISSVDALNKLSFSDTLPAGLAFATPSGLASTCGGVAVAATGPPASLSLSNGSVAAGGSCTVSANVRGIAVGTQVNSVTVSDAVAGTGNTATATIAVSSGEAFQVSYAGNLEKGESYINILNDGANGASLSGPGIQKTLGQICVNVYTFSPDEQMVSCCSCPVTSNGVANLGVKRDLVNNTLTGYSPSSVTIKLVATLAGGRGVPVDCKYSAMQVLEPVGGMHAWGSTLHPQNIIGGTSGYGTVENAFQLATLSAEESARLTNMCTNIFGNGSNYGICGSCQPGALGAGKQ